MGYEMTDLAENADSLQIGPKMSTDQLIKNWRHKVCAAIVAELAMAGGLILISPIWLLCACAAVLVLMSLIRLYQDRGEADTWVDAFFILPSAPAMVLTVFASFLVMLWIISLGLLHKKFGK